MCGFIAQLVEQSTGNAEVTGSNPVEALIFFFRLLLSNCLNWKIHCDDHSSLSSITAVQNELFHLFHISVFVVINFKTMYNETIIRFGFCDIQNNQLGLSKCYLTSIFECSYKRNFSNFLFLQDVRKDAAADEECIKPREPSHNKEQVHNKWHSIINLIHIIMFLL